jgi:molecular chaperone HscA
MLFEIAEPGQAKTKPVVHALGIDLGTTNSLVAVVQPDPAGKGAPKCLVIDEGSALLPSVVHYQPEESIDGPIVGQAARRLLAQAPRDTLASVKRFMGKSAGDAETKRLSPYVFVEKQEGTSAGSVRFSLSSGREVTPVEASAEILRVLKHRAEEKLKTTVSQAVITVPAYFDDAQRQATKDAGRLAGLEVLRLLNEPTAAALAYGLDKRSQGVFAVYDLGGGTFDVSILELKDGVFEVKSVGGDSALGGDDFDRALATHLLAQGDAAARYLSGGKESVPKAVTDAKRTRAAISAARRIKESLSNAQLVSAQDITANDANDMSLAEAEHILKSGLIVSLDPSIDSDKQFGTPDPKSTAPALRVSLQNFEQLVTPLVERTGPACKRALSDAGVHAPSGLGKENGAKLDGVILVGGSTRLPLVRKFVKELFGLEPLKDLNPDEVVALGAAVQADLLTAETPQHDVLLLDVTPLSLGLETMGGLAEKLIQRNTTIPASAAQEFTTFADGQNGMDIHVVQGERELVADCRSLARFTLSGIPALPAGLARVRVEFRVDADGILSVLAREMLTGVSQSITVKPAHGLTDDEVERMLLSSIENAQEDLDARVLIDARVEAQRILRATEKQLEENGDLLEAAERAAIDKAVEVLRDATTKADHRAITSSIEKLDRQSKEFAERIMNRGIERALKGHSVDEFQGTIGAHAKQALGVEE